MPTAPLRPCLKPGCPKLVQRGYCDAHRRQQLKVADSFRQTAAQRGYGPRWQKFRDAYLAKHPLCVTCLAEGRTEPATVVDHITPHKGDQKLFWQRGNHQPLCKRHHDIKTAREDGGFGRDGSRRNPNRN